MLNYLKNNKFSMGLIVVCILFEIFNIILLAVGETDWSHFTQQSVVMLLIIISVVSSAYEAKRSEKTSE